jgi:hypothetical protein
LGTVLLRMADASLIRARSWYRTPSVWVALVLAVSALPVLVARYPQMIDFPAHMARRHAGPWAKPLPARYYSFEWKWTGNLGVDILIRPFAALFGLELGSKIIVALVPPLTGIGIVWVEWALRRRIGFGTLLGLSFIWSPMLLLGLVNYALGQARADRLCDLGADGAARRVAARDGLALGHADRGGSGGVGQPYLSLGGADRAGGRG